MINKFSKNRIAEPSKYRKVTKHYQNCYDFLKYAYYEVVATTQHQPPMPEDFPEPVPEPVPDQFSSADSQSSPFEEGNFFDNIDYQPSGSSGGNSQSQSSQESNYDFEEVKNRILREGEYENQDCKSQA